MCLAPPPALVRSFSPRREGRVTFSLGGASVAMLFVVGVVELVGSLSVWLCVVIASVVKASVASELSCEGYVVCGCRCVAAAFKNIFLDRLAVIIGF